MHTLAMHFQQPAGSRVAIRVKWSHPPSSAQQLATSDGIFEFLVKAVPGSTAEQFSQLPAGSPVSVSQVMGRGFNLAALAPPEDCPSVLLFATGSGIRWGSLGPGLEHPQSSLQAGGQARPPAA